MDFFTTVEKRGSYRGTFINQPVPEADIRRILQAGIQAPSGKNLQTTSFVVVTDPVLRDKLAEILPTPTTQSAPVILVAVSEKIESSGMSFEIEDYAAAVENILLAITALGYAGLWMDGMTRKPDVSAAIAALLKVPAGKNVRTIIPFGLAAEAVTQKGKKTLEERVIWQQY